MKFRGYISIAFMAVRPKTLSVTVSPVMMGTIMAFSSNKGHFTAAIACFLSALLIQIGTNLSNDYFEFVKGSDTDERLGPTRVTQAGLVSPNKMLIIFVFVYLYFSSSFVSNGSISIIVKYFTK